MEIIKAEIGSVSERIQVESGMRGGSSWGKTPS
jgi:hypothetical protein